MTQKALWPWPSIHGDLATVDLTPDVIARIGRLVAIWDGAEHGAAALAEAGFAPLEGSTDAAFLAAVEVFLTQAELPRTAGTIANPWAQADDDARSLLDGMPDAGVAAELRAGGDIAFAAEPELLALWQAANLGGTGIDPKRPYGSTSVARDLRAILDPDKARGNAAFKALCARLEARLVLLLQFFVQTARLEPGLFRRGDDGLWRRVGPDDPPEGEALSRDEWIERTGDQHLHESRSYAETVRCLAHLVWTNRVAGDYAALCRQFRLHDLHDGPDEAQYAAPFEEQLRAGLRHFPEHAADDDPPVLTLRLARVLNAQARFAEAKAVLEGAGLWAIPRERVDFTRIDRHSTACLEGLAARRGLEILSDAEFQAVVSGTHSQWDDFAAGELWGFVWNVLHEPDPLIDTADWPGFGHATSLCAQIDLMRGGYVADFQPEYY